MTSGQRVVHVESARQVVANLEATLAVAVTSGASAPRAVAESPAAVARNEDVTVVTDRAPVTSAAAATDLGKVFDNNDS